jgi:transcriptional regulator with XRE-family HTH domain
MINERIREARRNVKMTQNALAKRIKVTSDYFTVKSGSSPNGKNLNLANALGTSPEWLLLANLLTINR